MIPQSFDKILFLDIETVPAAGQLAAMPEEMQRVWEEKLATLRIRMPDRYPQDTTADEAFENTAGIYAEFGKIVCIAVGFCYQKEGERHLRTKAFAGDDEKQLLSDFLDLVARFITTPYHSFCGHNIKEFDIPYICRRALVNGLRLPEPLRISGKKPWELNFIDTLDLWKFGDYKNYTSLKTLTALFGIPTPKDDIDGSEVAAVYYGTHDVERIAVYCQKDVVATAQVLLRLCGEPIIPVMNIETASL